MSDSFWHFKVQCPVCKKVEEMADGFETDDWTEVFTFSGCSNKNTLNGRMPRFKCQSCGTETDIDELYRLAYITTESIDNIKEYLFQAADTAKRRGGLYDHVWNPDLLRAIERYSSLYPEDLELRNLYKMYLRILYEKQL